MRGDQDGLTARGGKDAIWREHQSERIIFHTDRGSTYTAGAFTRLCRTMGIRQSMGRGGHTLVEFYWAGRHSVCRARLVFP